MTALIGTIQAYAGLVDGNARGELQRQGWLVCDGEEYAEQDYQELENTIGTIYGSSRPGMFNVPDLRGRFVRGVDAGAGRDPDTDSRNGGDVRTKLGSVQEDEFQSHLHVSRTPPWYYNEANYNNDSFICAARSPENNASGEHRENTSRSGGNETRPKNIYVNWLIKARNVD